MQNTTITLILMMILQTMMIITIIIIIIIIIIIQIPIRKMHVSENLPKKNDLMKKKLMGKITKIKLMELIHHIQKTTNVE